MNFLKRALISIRRSIGKTVLLFLLVTVLGSVISGAISVNQATEVTERNLKNSMLPVAMIELDWESLDEIIGNDENLNIYLTPDMIREVGALTYVRSYDYSARARLYGPAIEMYQPEFEEGMAGELWACPALGPAFWLKGVQNPEVFDIQEGQIELVEGRVFTSSEIENLTNVVLIPRNLANVNNLTVGSTISLRNVVVDRQNVQDVQYGVGIPREEEIFADESYDVEVIGIFDLAINPYTRCVGTDWHIVSDFENRIYAPNIFVEMVGRFHAEGLQQLHPDEYDGVDNSVFYENVFVLNNSAYLQDFQEAAREILSAHFRIVIADNAFQDVQAALTSMGQLTFRVLLISVTAALFIIALLIMLFLRDRQREIGIYLALGEKKSKIASQVLFEIMSIAFVSIVIALFIGNIIAGDMSETMFMNDLATRQAESMWNWNICPFERMGFSTHIPVGSILDTYNVSLTPKTIFVFLVVGLGTTILATVIPILYTMRLNPKKIML